MADDCLFCRIVRQEIDVPFVQSTADWVAFRDINPQAPTHILIVPREHIPSLNQAEDPTIVGKLTLAARALAESEGIAESGYRTVVNTNRDAGQTVFHLHLHLLGGRAMSWPPG